MFVRIDIDDEFIRVGSEDGVLVYCTPVRLYPSLQKATPEQRKNYRILADEEGVCWPDLDLDLEISQIIKGEPEKIPKPPDFVETIMSVTQGEEMESHYDRVKTFMKLAGQEVPPKPMIPVDQVQEFRLQLIFEEFAELIEACGYSFEVIDKKLVLKKERATDLVEVADAFADISVVNVGGSIAFGLPFPEIITEVDRNNLAKFGPGGYRREDGKWIKPPDHKPPKIQEIVEKHLEKKDEV